MPRFLSVILALIFAAPIRAQETATAPVRDPSPMLADCLRAAGSDEQRVLFAVVPTQDVTRPLPLSVFPKNVGSFLAAWNKVEPRNIRRIERFGNITAFVPKKQGVYTKNLQPITALGATGDKDGVQNDSTALLAYLSQEQWKRAASEGGLGYADLRTPEQQALWNKVVPEPFGYRTTTAQGERHERLLTDAERNRVRVRVTLTARVYTNNADGTRTMIHWDKNRASSPHDDAYLIGASGLSALLDAAGREPVASKPYFTDYTDDDGNEWRHSQMVYSFQTNLPKRSEWKLAQNAAVSLTPPEGSAALTMSELARRIEAATGFRFVAHKGLEGLSVVSAGKSSVVSVQNLIPTLCLSVGGTVRRMPDSAGDATPLYVLTRDIEPLALLHDRVDRWYNSSQFGTKNAEYTTLSAQIAAKDVLDLLEFDADDPVSLTRPLRERYKKEAQIDPLVTGRFGVRVAPSELPVAQREYLDAVVQSRRENKRGTESGDPRTAPVPAFSGYRISADVRLNLLAPDEPFAGGRVSEGFTANYGSLLAPQVAPESPVSPSGRVLFLCAENESEARQAVQIAKRCGAASLWLDAPPQALPFAITDAQRLPVFAVLRPWEARTAPVELERDENPYGEKSARYLQPDSPTVEAWARERIRRVSTVPGLQGMVWRDVFPSGYRGSRSNIGNAGAWTGEPGSYDYDRRRPLVDQWGYRADRRRSYLLEKGIDPVDILLPVTSDIGEGNSKADSYFRCQKPIYNEWLDFNHGRCVEVLKRLLDGVGMPVFLEGITLFQSGTAQRAKLPKTDDKLEWFVPSQTESAFAELCRGAWNDLPLPDAKTGAVVGIVSPITTSPQSEILERSKRTATPALTVVDWSNRTLAGIEAELSKPVTAPP